MNQMEIKKLIQTGMEELNRTLYEGKSERLLQCLRAMAMLPHYSFRNCVLIEQQVRQRGLPPATLVLGYQSWRKLGRFVKKGEKGLGIVAPLRKNKPESDNILREANDPNFGFRVVHVFDVSQTEGKVLPAIATPTGDPGPWLLKLEEFIVESGAEVLYQPLRKGLCGKTFGRSIVISESIDDTERLLTLAHEFAHFKLHSDKATWRTTTKSMRETEAEAVACIVGCALGIDCMHSSADYIHLHNGDAQQFTQRMNRIQQTATHILTGMRKSSCPHTEREPSKFAEGRSAKPKHPKRAA